jgi:GntR family galactonate operon transcriptional repressor
MSGARQRAAEGDGVPASERAILAEYIEARRVLDTIAAGLAAERATADDLTALADALARMSAAGEDDERYQRATSDFHRALFAAGHNRALQSVLCAARRPLAPPERGCAEHQRILVAVAQGDPEAARRAAGEHLDGLEAYLRRTG